MWRPDNWDDLVNTDEVFKILSRIDEDSCAYWGGIEVGADIILQALKEKADSMFFIGAMAGADRSILKCSIENKRGWLVFIPDDEKSKEAKNGSKT